MLRHRLGVAVAAVSLSTPFVLSGTVAHASPTAANPAARFATTARGEVSDTYVPTAANSTKKVAVIVQMAGDPVAVVQAQKGTDLSEASKAQIRNSLKAKQDALKGAIAARDGQVQTQMQSAYNGMRVEIPENQVASLTTLPGVVAVKPVPHFNISNTVSVPYIGAPSVWQNTGYTGKGVKVAIIDTGIDYTHADFGGPGTKDAYAKAHAADADPADPALFGPNAPRVKGGYDFVGDDYDPNDPAHATPKPDSNPLDCGGHGSHVAGSTAGSGETIDGKTYTGPYNASTPKKKFKIGPGVAPQADLYALKVFGCEGSTDVTTEAIDWAVKNNMNVINMSLGSTYGEASDASSVAASNAVAAGVVVVAASGNEGPSPYMTGSPGSGKGVISVAANDSAESFPGATLTVNGSPMAAINANGVDPLPTGPFKVVVLKDDPATPENEALGCSVNAFAKAGITTDPAAEKVVAVVKRGTCARVSKAVYGQQAGADAVIQINTTDDYPPYEGTITENADTHEKYDVTIPLLGVRSSDAAALTAADGTTLTMAPAPLKNPAFSKIANFSSAGPRNGDSGLKPSITAPGVSIHSVGVGTGNDEAVMSGTSMATPHVAGVAALTVQAHPKWSASDISAAIINTGLPAKVNGYTVTGAGSGLVNPVGSVNDQVVALGDVVRTDTANYKEPTLSFGYASVRSTYSATKTVTLKNNSGSDVTYNVAIEKNVASSKASVTTSTRTITVPAHHTAKFQVTVSVKASDLGSSVSSDDEWNLFQVAGNVRLVPTSGLTLRVPYLLVPRVESNVNASIKMDWNNPTTPNVVVSNRNGGITGTADFYSLGLVDPKGDNGVETPGTDLRAVGVQSSSTANGTMLVFAVNTWDRFSNAASNEYDVAIDTDGDGKTDYIVYSADAGQVTSKSANGIAQVFVYDVATKKTTASGFIAQAPTDRSTILLPVMTSDLGLGDTGKKFTYTASVSSMIDSASTDEFSGTAIYDPTNKAVADGQFVTVAPNATATVPVAVNLQQVVDTKPLGVMIVSFDNKAGSDEATLLPGGRSKNITQYLQTGLQAKGSSLPKASNS